MTETERGGELHPVDRLERRTEGVRHEGLDRGHVADHDHGLAGVRRHHPVAALEHPLLHGPERLTAVRRGLEVAEPGAELVGPLLVHLGEAHPVPGAELHLGDARLLLDLEVEELRQDLRRLARTTDRGADQRVEGARQRSQPLPRGPGLRAALVVERRVAAGQPAGEQLALGRVGDAVPHQDQRGGLALGWAPAALGLVLGGFEALADARSSTTEVGPLASRRPSSASLASRSAWAFSARGTQVKWCRSGRAGWPRWPAASSRGA